MIADPRISHAAGRLLALSCALGLLSACAPPAPRSSPLPMATEIPALEARYAQDANDLQLLIRLGLAYRQAGDLDQAQVVLQRAATQRPDDPAAALALGLVFEDLERYAEARVLYERYLEAGRTEAIRDQLLERLALLERKELDQAVRTSLAREAELADTPSDPRRIAVYPFLYAGADPALEPLGLALAELLVTDLAQTRQLTILERARVQLLLDEMQLAREGLVDPSTAPRSGRLLGAGHIVQGRIDGGEELLRLQAAVVDVTAPSRAGSVAEQDALAQLFEMQTRLALSILRSLGVTVSEEERARLSQHPTTNLQALVAYGLGLRADDDGDFALAVEHFARAVALDPGFAEARARQRRAARMVAASRVTTTDLVELGAAEFSPRRSALPESLISIRDLVPRGPGRDPTAELLGQDVIGNQAILEIILRRP